MSDLEPDALARLIDLARPLLDDPDPPVDFFGKYELLRELGRGATSVVYEASYAYGGARWRVAIKVLADGGFTTSTMRQRFWTEALAATRLVHPHIVRILEVHSRYLVLQYIEGASLAGVRWPGPEAARLMTDVVGAVHAAHQQGVIHRDLKPANLLRCTRTGRLYVTDFGLAHCGGRDDLAIVGTPGFIAPEQLRGEAPTPAADVYSLGATLRAVSDDLHGLAARCLAERPADRPTMPELSHALGELTSQ